jgi:hypothetical protein
MKRLSAVLVAFLLAGCSALSSTGEGEANNRVPLVCSSEHTQSPCAGGVEVGHAYRFNLVTHCGVEWAYFNGRYWEPRPKVHTPSDWEGIEPGTMLLEDRIAVFEATKGGSVRFVTAAASYQPSNCE